MLSDWRRAGRVVSIDRVTVEPEKGQDELAAWARDHDGRFASRDEDATLDADAQVMEWIQAQDQFHDAPKAACADGADGRLIAFALAHRCTVVTHEQPSAAARKRVPMPKVCQTAGAVRADPFAILRALGLRLESWHPRPRPCP